MAAELVNMATSEKLTEMDWMKNIEICELIARDQGQAKNAIKQIKKRLGSKHQNTQVFAVMLLEMLLNNCGEHIHKQVIDNGLLRTLVKIVKKKSDLPVRERIFLLLDSTQTALGGASGKFPQYYTAYHELVSAGVRFTQQLPAPPPKVPLPKEEMRALPVQEPLTQKCEDGRKDANGPTIPDSSIIHKAASVYEVLKDVLNALDPKHPEGASDEFVLDLVEQCSFQKQRVMHLVMTSRDEKVVPQAIELNEQLQKILTQHDDLLSVRATSTAALNAVVDEDEEEDEEHILRRIRKGKACAEDYSDSTVGSIRYIPDEKIRPPLLRPLCIQPADYDNKPQAASIPPPPAKHTERENFFKEKHADGPGLNGHMKGLSLHRRSGSSSHSGSTDFSEYQD